jgi:hypothetical protein
MSRALTALLCAGVVAAQGFVAGRWTGRWGASERVREAAGRLAGLPSRCGEWEGRDLEVNPRHQAMAEVDGCLLRSYSNVSGGVTLSLLVVCGRPGPIGSHTPDVCYRGAGYDLLTPQHEVSVDSGGGMARFWHADFRQRNTPIPRHLRIFWAWSDGRAWEAAEHPRLKFGTSPVLYKLYVVRELAVEGEPVESDPALAFLRRLLPVLEPAVSGQPKQ